MKNSLNHGVVKYRTESTNDWRKGNTCKEDRDLPLFPPGFPLGPPLPRPPPAPLVPPSSRPRPIPFGWRPPAPSSLPLPLPRPTPGGLRSEKEDINQRISRFFNNQKAV